jgi:hypothetical protein
MKRKERVPPSTGTGLISYDGLVEDRFPKSRGTKLKPEQPPAYPYRCKPNCETCFTQYFPARLEVTDVEALSAIQMLSGSIYEDLRTVQDALRQHADFLVTRWRKKSVAKRTEFLSRLSPTSTAYPELKNTTPDGNKETYDRVQLFEHKWATVHLINDRSRDKSEDGESQSDFSTLLE